MAATVLFGQGSGTVAAPSAAAAPATVAAISLDDRLREVETNLIGWALKVAEGNKSRAAELLNIKRSTLGDRIARCGLAEPRSQEESVPAAS